MKKIFLIISLVELCLGAVATEQPDAIYRLIRRQYTINQDGTMDINHRKEITILRNRALTAYADKGETFITYNPNIEELIINESYTLTSDGRKVETPSNAFVKQLPENCLDCGRYNNIVEMAVIHTGMEYNCTIVLDYTIHRKDILNSDIFSMQMDCPVENYEIIYDHGGRVARFDIPSVGSPIQDGHNFHWVAHNIPQKSGEPYTSPVDPYQVGVTFKNVLKPEIATELPESENILGELYQEDKMAYIIAIRDWVRDNIHHNPMNAALTNYLTTPAVEVFNSNCGNQLDHYALLVAMLRQAGFEADIDDEAFTTGHFSPQRIRVAVKHNGMTYLLAMNSRPAVLKNGAQELDKVNEKNLTIKMEPTRIGENYYCLVLPEEPKGQIDPVQLTTQRKQPLFLRPVKEHYEYTIELNGEYKLLTPVRIKYSKSGLGKIEITVKQIDGHTLQVVRCLELLPTTVETKLYPSLRKMIIDWNSVQDIKLEKK